jgi:hypothetical protein
MCICSRRFSRVFPIGVLINENVEDVRQMFLQLPTKSLRKLAALVPITYLYAQRATRYHTCTRIVVM